MILVTGSTGTVGSHLVRLLVEGGQRVRAVVAPGDPAVRLVALGAEIAEADFDDEVAIKQAAQGMNRVFVLVPPSARQTFWQQRIISAARDADYVVKLSAFDTGPASPLTLGRWHYQGEEDLRRLGVPHTILRPQYFTQNLLVNQAAIAAGTLPTFIEPDAPVGMIDAFDVAACAAAVLTADQPERYGRVLVPTGPRPVTVKDVAGALTESLMRPVVADHLGPERGRTILAARGLPDWHIDDVLTICSTASELVTNCVFDVTGRPARDIDATVRSVYTLPK